MNRKSETNARDVRATADTLMPEQDGDLIAGKYRLIRLLGQGGMGAVHAAYHEQLGKTVAIKLMKPEFAQERDVVERFYREARAASATGHPGIVAIHDIGIDEGRHFMVMDMLDGEPLDARLHGGKRLCWDEAVRILHDMLGALTAVHEKGIVHRDIKPENVFMALDEEGEHVKILDFGISRQLDQDESARKLTSTGMVLGTPYYLSPEQARGLSDVDQRADVYACGVMLYQMICGVLPYNGNTVAALFFEILSGKPARLESHGVDLPEGLADAVHRAMALDREDRWESARDLREALEPFLDESLPVRQTSGELPEPLQVDPADPLEQTGQAWSSTHPGKLEPPARPRSRRRLVLGLGGLALGGIVVAAIVAALWSSGDVDRSPAATPDDPGSRSGVAGPVNEPASADTVSVALTGLPDGARLTIDGSEVKNPVTMETSDESVQITVEADGFVTRTVSVVPDRDVQKQIVLEPESSSTPAKKQPPSPTKTATASAPAAEEQPLIVEPPEPPPEEVAKAQDPEPEPSTEKKKLTLDLDYDSSKEREAE